MDSVAALSEESGEEKPRLLGYYQQLLMAAAEQRQESEAVREPEEAENGPGEEEEDFSRRRDEQRGVILQLSEEARNAGTLQSDETDEKAQGLTPEDEDLINRLKQRDQEVRRHEMAHVGALGADAGIVRYTYQIGPDGRAYAVGGSTEVDMGPEATDAATRAKAQRIRAAAMAASEPSSADVAVASQAAQMERNARV